MEEQQDTIFEEEKFNDPKEGLAQVNFDMLESSGRWMLKVIAGPNSGAEFSMQPGSSYLIGTDATSCDIVFHDFSVSRQHARIAVESEDKVTIEDLNSRNGTFVDGQKITSKQQISASSLITMGTTTFIIVDWEGEHATIVAPPLIAALEKASETSDAETVTKSKHLDNNPLDPIKDATFAPLQNQLDLVKAEERNRTSQSHTLGALLILAAVTGLFIIVGIGTTMLFKTETMTIATQANPEEFIKQALKDYPSVRYSFNPSNGRLLLLGHVGTAIDRGRILDALQSLKFISAVDANNIVIDQYVWQEANQILQKNPAWRGVTIYSPEPGKFIMTGFLKSHKQAEELYDYINHSFPYVDLLEKRVVVEEDLLVQVRNKLLEKGFRNVKASFKDGELSLTGSITSGQTTQLKQLIDEIKTKAGVRSIQNSVTEAAKDQSMINLSDKYVVTGHSQQGGVSLSVVINGRILTKGDQLDGMTIIEIRNNVIFLQKDGVKYRIDFNR